MKRVIATLVLLFLCSTVSAAVPPETARKLYQQVTPSLVAVQYAWVTELGRHELIGAGVVVGEDLVMVPLELVSPQIPDEQMKEFKIIVPQAEEDPQEIDAVFQGRDERTNMGLVKAREPQHWKPITFEEAPPQVGDTILSVGVLPQLAAYKSYIMEANVSALLRGEQPQVMVQGGGLAAVGSPVFNLDGKAIGFVMFQQGQGLLLNDRRNALNAISNPPRFFVPARDFLLTISDPPTPDKPIAMPYMGAPELKGVTKEVSEALGLKNQPAIQVEYVVPDSPAAKAGLKQGDIIVKSDGKALERGDEAAELPDIFKRRLLRHKPGETVTLSVLREVDKPLTDIKVTLGDQPKRANAAKRFYAEDLGFVVRDLVFMDTYLRHLPADQKGVEVDLERPQSSAQSGGLRPRDIIVRMNNMPVTDVEQFEKDYKALRKDKPREAVVLVVQRDNKEDTIRIEPPQ
jgi:serine protease Do